ncbi:MAG: hypothetical protein NTW86_17045 [Candidatus Sumerlaeota bacterium]|nr:hypothetical protein [Candidatus Sumerlaeota bacterium]
MTAFPRTTVGGVSLSRMIIGTNWFLGYSHCTKAKGTYLRKNVADRNKIADIIEVFLRAGVDTIMCPHTKTILPEAIQEAEDRAGVKAVIVSTPGFTATPRTPFDGFDLKEVEQVLDEETRKGVAVCMPHVSVTDKMVDKCTREIRRMDVICRLIRERGMIPGLSTHTPETVVFADESGLDVETYIQIFNAMGFLMQIEVDWVARLIQKAKKPVMAIKPMAAGQLRPFQALTFVWNAIRERDMVAVGTMCPEEAEELIDLSLSILAKRPSGLDLQETRSKAILTGART